jgi:hypothetical protein
MKLDVRVVGTLVVACGLAVAADAQLDFYDTNVVFTGSHTRPLAGQGSGAFISPDGKFAGFMTTRHGLKFGDIPQTTDVFLRSLTGGQTYGLNKFAGKYFPVESEYQHLAVMPSNQGLVNFFVVENPLAGLSTARTQIYVHHRETGETSVASVPPVGTASLGFCDPVAIDNLGTRLIFTGAKPQDQYGIYVRDFATGTTTLVHEPIRGHRPVLGVSANGLNILYRDGSGLSLFKNGVKSPIFSASASVYTPHWVSDDGKIAILESTAALNPLDVGGNDLYVLNLETKAGVRLPRPNTEVSLRAVHVSRNGRFIAVAPYSTVKTLVFDRTTNKWTDFTPYNVGQEFPESIAIDNSGNNVVMNTYYQNPMWLSRSSRVARYLDDVGQPNLPDDLQNFAVTPDERFAFVRSRDIFRDGVYRSVRRDMTTGGDVVVPNNPMPIAVSNNGRYVLGRPDSLAVHQHVDLKRGGITNLVGNPVGMDGSGNLVVFLANNQVWVRNISRGEEYLLSYTAAGLGGNRPSGSAVISNDGRFVYFTSSARDLAAGRELPYDPEFDEVDKSLYRWDSHTRTTQLVLVPRGEDLTFDGVEGPQVSADGRFVAFTYLVSSADNFYFPMILDTQTGSWQKVPGGTTRILSISPDGQYALITDEFRLRVLRLGDGKEAILVTDEFYGTTFAQGQMTNNRRVWFSLAGALVRGRYEFR